jgi:hypothetical protein
MRNEHFKMKKSMPKTTKRKTKKKIAGINLSPFIIVAFVIGFVLTCFIVYRASISDRKLFSISLIALFGGLLFESIRVSGNWKIVATIFIGSYLFSLLSFFPGRREHAYNFDNHIAGWPYVFIIIFTIFFVVINKNKVTVRLTEGITLLLSIAMVYWVLDYGFINFNSKISVILITIGFLLSVFSIINSLTNIRLSKTIRLILSIWSSIVMFAFAIDNIYRVFNNPDIESSKYLSDGLFTGIQYFLLGVSAVYIMNNYLLLAGFLPNKNSNYKKDLKENIKEHIERYSDEQVSNKYSLFCIVYCGAIFLLNYKYQILPRHTMIWLVFLTFPMIIKVISFYNSHINHKPS